MTKFSIHPSLPREQEWSDFVAAHPQGNFFQTSRMFDFLSQTAHHDPVLLLARDDVGKISAMLLAVFIRNNGLLSRYVSGRTIVWGGPLISTLLPPDDRQECLAQILSALNQYDKGRSVFIEFRNLFDLKEFQTVFRENRYQYSDHLNFIVNTLDYELVKKNISSSKMRQVKKSIRNGAEVIEADCVDQVKSFYEILRKLYKEKVKKPLPSWDFFREFFLLGHTKDSARFLLVRYRGEIIGGMMCPIMSGKAIYEWYVCGKDSEYIGVYPSVLATWGAIEYALQHGLKCFDFMGAGKPGKDYGVREFKSKFGGTQVNHGRFIKIQRAGIYNLGKGLLEFISPKK